MDCVKSVADQEWSKEWYDQRITEVLGEGNHIDHIWLMKVECSKSVLDQILSATLERASTSTGLETVAFDFTPAWLG